MLVLICKVGQKVRVGDDIVVELVEVEDRGVVLGFGGGNWIKANLGLGGEFNLGAVLGGEDTTVKLVEVKDGSARLSFDAPEHVRINLEEVRC